MSKKIGKEGDTLPPSPSSQDPVPPHAAASPAAEARRLTWSEEPATRVLDQPPPAVAMPEHFGRYRILRVLSDGATGTVYLAHDAELDREVALKVPPFSPNEGAAAVECFLASARAAATLTHPNLCPVYEAGQCHGIPYLTMPSLDGRPLATLLQQGPPLLPGQALALVHKLALALETAHQQGIVHGDLNPRTILITPDGEPIVVDFGLARRESCAQMTQTGQALGTPGYSAPEQLSGVPEAQGIGCDIFSLGVILYELLTGELPFGRATPAVRLQLMARDLVPPSARRPGITPALDAVCARALAWKAQDRYRNMGELAQALRANLETGSLAAAGSATDPVRGTPSNALVRAGAKPRPAPGTVAVGWRWAAVGGAVALLVGMGVGAWWLAKALLPAKPAAGAVLLEIDQPGAEVFVDGRQWTVTLAGDKEPSRIELPEGQHELKVTRDGFETYTTAIAFRPGQTERIRAVLEPEGNPTQRFEAETLEVAAFEGCTISEQDMSRYRGGSWSKGKQLFCRGGVRGSWVEWRFPVQKEGHYHLDLLATQAPDFGKLQASLDGKSMPEIIDTYGASVQPLKPRRLGTFLLTAGKHGLRLTVVGQNDASTSSCFGIDAFDLTLDR
jgi:hypothetical protein